MRLAIRHTTRYRFADPVAHGLQRLRLTPKETQGQTIVEWTIEYSGAREELAYDDQNHNHVTLVSVDEGAHDVVIACRGVVETEDIFTSRGGKLVRAQGFPPHADRFARHGIDLVDLLSGAAEGTPPQPEPAR